MRTARLRISLRDASPAVVRVIDVPATSTRPELHELFQVALGWTNSHLHQFVADGLTYGVVDPDGDDGLHSDEARVRLRDLPTRFVYLYDPGDGWDHDVDVVGRGDDVPGCVDGAGDCPPEDCGGAPGYAELRAVLADPGHDEHARLREWAGELPSFDCGRRRPGDRPPAAVVLRAGRVPRDPHRGHGRGGVGFRSGRAQTWPTAPTRCSVALGRWPVGR